MERTNYDRISDGPCWIMIGLTMDMIIVIIECNSINNIKFGYDLCCPLLG